MRFDNAERRLHDELQAASAVLRYFCLFRNGDRFSVIVHESEVFQMPLKGIAMRHLLTKPSILGSRTHEA